MIRASSRQPSIKISFNWGQNMGESFQHGPWRVLQRKAVYQDPWLKVERDDVIRPDGESGTYCVAYLKPGVCVVAIDHHQQISLTSEFHYGVGRITLEAVSGGIEPGDTPMETARRELLEEVGLTARTWIALGVVDPFTANVVSPTRLYLAMGLTQGEAQPEGTEVIESVQMPLKKAIDMVMRSEITHAPSCEAILRAGMHLGVFRWS